MTLLCVHFVLKLTIDLNSFTLFLILDHIWPHKESRHDSETDINLTCQELD